MAIATPPKMATLFLGVMFTSEEMRDQSLALFIKQYGPIVSQAGPFSFSEFSSYYDKEIGGTVYKEYYLFEQPIHRESLADIKEFTNSIEQIFATEGNRPVNLDPGYLASDKFVLASAKDFSHRIYIGKGIYAEVTLHFHQNKIRFFSWTYQDYLRPEVQQFLLEGRTIHSPHKQKSLPK